MKGNLINLLRVEESKSKIKILNSFSWLLDILDKLKNISKITNRCCNPQAHPKC